MKIILHYKFDPRAVIIKKKEKKFNIKENSNIN